MKKAELNGQQLALLSNALSKDLFPKPYEGELLSETLYNGNCVLYFEDDYFDKLDFKIKEKYNEGAFAKSNAEAEWNDLMEAINTSKATVDNTENADNYWLSLPIKDRPNIEIENKKNKKEDIFKDEPVTRQEIEHQLELLDEEMGKIFPAYLEAKKTANWEDSEIAKKYKLLSAKFQTLWSKVAHHYE
ncbi:hypothetical protein OAU19_00160 [Flavobacteriaceae bacterium]|nr:hypothetical protein [Flavobacteriaceae bacterium]